MQTDIISGKQFFKVYLKVHPFNTIPLLTHVKSNISRKTLTAVLFVKAKQKLPKHQPTEANLKIMVTYMESYIAVYKN